MPRLKQIKGSKFNSTTTGPESGFNIFETAIEKCMTFNSNYDSAPNPRDI